MLFDKWNVCCWYLPGIIRETYWINISWKNTRCMVIIKCFEIQMEPSQWSQRYDLPLKCNCLVLFTVYHFYTLSHLIIKLMRFLFTCRIFYFVYCALYSMQQSLSQSSNEQTTFQCNNSTKTLPCHRWMVDSYFNQIQIIPTTKKTQN